MPENLEFQVNFTGAILEGMSLEVRTSVLPPIRFSLSADGQGSNPLIAWLKPSVTVVDGTGTRIASATPYGEPNGPESWWPLLSGLFATGAVIWWVFRK